MGCGADLVLFDSSVVKLSEESDDWKTPLSQCPIVVLPPSMTSLSMTQALPPIMTARKKDFENSTAPIQSGSMLLRRISLHHTKKLTLHQQDIVFIAASRLAPFS
jgi:hypothetical protein